jgi:hypothetical protein
LNRVIVPVEEIISRGRRGLLAIAPATKEKDFARFRWEDNGKLPPKSKTQRNFRTNAKQKTKLNVNGV